MIHLEKNNLNLTLLELFFSFFELAKKQKRHSHDFGTVKGYKLKMVLSDWGLFKVYLRLEVIRMIKKGNYGITQIDDIS